jgi:hypothetical protein
MNQGFINAGCKAEQNSGSSRHCPEVKSGNDPSLVLIIVYPVAHMISIGFECSIPRENIGKGSD